MLFWIDQQNLHYLQECILFRKRGNVTFFSPNKKVTKEVGQRGATKMNALWYDCRWQSYHNYYLPFRNVPLGRLLLVLFLAKQEKYITPHPQKSIPFCIKKSAAFAALFFH